MRASKRRFLFLSSSANQRQKCHTQYFSMPDPLYIMCFQYGFMYQSRPISPFKPLALFVPIIVPSLVVTCARARVWLAPKAFLPALATVTLLLPIKKHFQKFRQATEPSCPHLFQDHDRPRRRHRRLVPLRCRRSPHLRRDDCNQLRQPHLKLHQQVKPCLVFDACV